MDRQKTLIAAKSIFPSTSSQKKLGELWIDASASCHEQGTRERVKNCPHIFAAHFFAITIQAQAAASEATSLTVAHPTDRSRFFHL